MNENTQDVAAWADTRGDVVFNVGSVDAVLRLASNGDIFVHGRLAANDLEVVDALREWLAEANRKPLLRSRD